MGIRRTFSFSRKHLNRFIRACSTQPPSFSLELRDGRMHATIRLDEKYLLVPVNIGMTGVCRNGDDRLKYLLRDQICRGALREIQDERTENMAEIPVFMKKSGGKLRFLWDAVELNRHILISESSPVNSIKNVWNLARVTAGRKGVFVALDIKKAFWADWPVGGREGIWREHSPDYHC